MKTTSPAAAGQVKATPASSPAPPAARVEIAGAVVADGRLRVFLTTERGAALSLELALINVARGEVLERGRRIIRGVHRTGLTPLAAAKPSRSLPGQLFLFEA